MTPNKRNSSKQNTMLKQIKSFLHLTVRKSQRLVDKPSRSYSFSPLMIHTPCFIFKDVLQRMGAVGGLSTMITIDALGDSGQASWPLVSVNGFHEKGLNARSLSGALYLSLSPVVARDDIFEWEQYVQSDANEWM